MSSKSGFVVPVHPRIGWHSWIVYFVAIIAVCGLSIAPKARAAQADVEKRIEELTNALKSAGPGERGGLAQALVAADIELANLQLETKKYQPAIQTLRKARGVANQHPDGRRAQDLAGDVEVRITLADWREKNDGRGLKGQIYQGKTFGSEFASRIDPNIDFLWGWAVPTPGFKGDAFSVRWTGFINAPKPGTYKLIALHDDGCTIWIDDKQVIDKKGIGDFRTEAFVSFTGKPQPIRIEYYDDHGPAKLSLHWQVPGRGGEAVVPPEVFFNDKDAAARLVNKPYALPKGFGLSAEYFAGQKPVPETRRITRADANIDYCWIAARPDPTLGDGFTVQWSGFICAPKAGRYRLIVLADDWARIALDDVPVMNEPKRGQHETNVELTGKPQPFRFIYKNYGGDAYVTLYWQRLGEDAGEATIIPASAFFADKFTAQHAPKP